KQIVCLSDGAWDWRFLLNLFPLSEDELRWPSRFNVAGRMIHNYLPEDSGNLFNDAMEAFFQNRGHVIRKRGGERHHALVDALALRHAWRACWSPKE
ncbi:MAG: 3'-5' exoribonuclease, partial [Bryobacterales bacterium]|nr:3'-5' exoribonuclease [Bryobacterales bacterium]